MLHFIRLYLRFKVWLHEDTRAVSLPVYSLEKKRSRVWEVVELSRSKRLLMAQALQAPAGEEFRVVEHAAVDAWYP